MKKVLFATTALVASAGVAAAQGIALSGSAEMGIAGGDAMDTQFFQTVDVRFTMSGETDNGLSFGATIDLDDLADMAIIGHDPVNIGGDDQFADFSVFISGDWGTLTMGDTDGALDRVMQEANTAMDPGSIADDESSHGGYLGSYLDGDYDGQVLRYEYSFGDFLIALSAEQDLAGGGGDGSKSIGLRYSTSVSGVDMTFGLGYQTNSDPAADAFDYSATGVSVLAEFAAGFSVALAYTDFENVTAGSPTDGADDSHIAVGLGYGQGPITLHANYGEWDSGASGYGLAAGYDLGGGASILAGYGETDGGDSSWSFGLSMSF